jgi:hypothetical protein
MKKFVFAVTVAMGFVVYIDRAQAGNLDLTSYNTQGITGSFDGNHRTEYGGVITGTLNGQSLNMFCVEAFVNIGVPSSSPVMVTNNGFIHGSQIGNSGEIAYLIADVGQKVGTNVDKQNALQAAIWHLVSPTTGHSFEMLPGDNSAAVYSYYTADLAAAVGKSVPLSHVLWISPYADVTNTNGITTYSTPLQGQAAAATVLPDLTPASIPNLSPATIPEPSSFVLLGLGVIGVAVGAYRRRH